MEKSYLDYRRKRKTKNMDTIEKQDQFKIFIMMEIVVHTKENGNDNKNMNNK